MKRKYPEPTYGRRVLLGQFTHKEGERTVDEAERRNFDKSKYIPGNGAQHRLGKHRESQP